MHIDDDRNQFCRERAVMIKRGTAWQGKYLSKCWKVSSLVDVFVIYRLAGQGSPETVWETFVYGNDKKVEVRPTYASAL